MEIKVPQLIAVNKPDAYLVGGCVRDLIRGLAPMDYDIAVSSAPRALAQQIVNKNGGRIVVLGKDRFTVYRVASPAWTVDITSYKGGAIHQDLLSRDFTINALACSLAGSQILDVTGGLSDLHHGVVRMTSPAVFAEDPVRLVRAFRMAATLDFRIEPQTVDTIRTHAALLGQSAAERVWAEFMRILVSPRSYKHLQQMAVTRVLHTIIPELTEILDAGRNCSGSCIDSKHPLLAVNALEQILNNPGRFLPAEPAGFVESIDRENCALLKMSLLIHGIGKSTCRRAPVYGQSCLRGYAARSAKAAESIGRRLKMSNRQRQWIESLVRMHRRPFFLFSAGGSTQSPPPRAIGRFFRQCGRLTPHLLLHAMADSIARGKSDNPRIHGFIKFLGDIFSNYYERKITLGLSPILSGDDLIHIFKLRPSPFLGKILRGLEERQLAGEVIDRQQALQWVADYLRLAH